MGVNLGKILGDWVAALGQKSGRVDMLRDRPLYRRAFGGGGVRAEPLISTKKAANRPIIGGHMHPCHRSLRLRPGTGKFLDSSAV